MIDEKRSAVKRNGKGGTGVTDCKKVNWRQPIFWVISFSMTKNGVFHKTSASNFFRNQCIRNAEIQ